VSKQVEFVYDGILGNDFLQYTRARVCYDSDTVTFRKDSKGWTEKITWNKGMQGNKEDRGFSLPKISKIIAKLPEVSSIKSHKEIYVAGVKVNKATNRKWNKRNEGVGMAIPGVKRKRYTPDSPELKIRTSYKGT
jgi:hypothetical protein